MSSLCFLLGSSRKKEDESYASDDKSKNNIDKESTQQRKKKHIRIIRFADFDKSTLKLCSDNYRSNLASRNSNAFHAIIQCIDEKLMMP